MQPQILEPGYVVQLSPQLVKNRRFRGCLMTIVEQKQYGATGYIQIPSELPDGDLTLIYYNASWDEMRPVGVASWLCGSDATVPVEIRNRNFQG